MQYFVFILVALQLFKPAIQKSLDTGTLSSDTCDLETRVIGGSSILAQESPWHAILEMKKNENMDKIEAYCGGSVISDDIILTAAHCLWGNDHNFAVCPQEIRSLETAEKCHQQAQGCPAGCLRVRPQDLNIYVGITSVRQPNKSPQSVEAIYINEQWMKKISSRENVKAGHDLAIVHLKKSLNFTKAIQPISLPTKNFTIIPNTNVTVNGFGSITPLYVTPAECLQQGLMQIVAKDECNSSYSYRIEGDQLCAISVGVDSCKGDSGGGLTTGIADGQQRSQSPILVGVTSFGPRFCGSRPGVYTNVQTHLDWIQQRKTDIGQSTTTFAQIDMSCSMHETCETRKTCIYIQKKYRDYRKANPTERTNIINLLKSMVCNKKKKAYCCPQPDCVGGNCPENVTTGKRKRKESCGSFGLNTLLWIRQRNLKQ